MLNVIGVAVDLLPVLVFVVSFHLEPRKLRTGVYLLIALGWLVLLAVGWLISISVRYVSRDAGGYILLGFVGVAVLTVTGFAVFLVNAGITLILREGFGIRRLLSLILGSLLLGFMAVTAIAITREDSGMLLWLFLIGMPAGYVAFGFSAFVLYGVFYPAWMARFAPAPGVVVVLGSGLIDGAVPPLLAARLRKGRAVFERGRAADGRPALVTSGGKGEDEPVAEAVAMRDFLIQEGVEPASLLVEDRSRNTEENLAFTAELIQERQLTGPVAVVTSDFHALRAALLMRKAGLPGYTLGARTARYFWPTAVIREYAAVVRDHFWLNAVMIALTAAPLIVATVATLAGWAS